MLFKYVNIIRQKYNLRLLSIYEYTNLAVVAYLKLLSQH
jgi:hypothetical protein